MIKKYYQGLIISTGGMADYALQIYFKIVIAQVIRSQIYRWINGLGRQ